jgi:hypothetical protein
MARWTLHKVVYGGGSAELSLTTSLNIAVMFF